MAVRRAIEDYLIVGRGVLRVTYEPVVVEGDPEMIPVRQQPITASVRLHQARSVMCRLAARL